ncbi:hypothetical protein PIIN_00820 [Serendipita indica DSM 11827]|uniref:Transmembrane protein n=1 Tax=Serendipita indica (strain DSM 11827) TaxID=1109443 RepID=G4T6S0_SERID|nr:hypothetical protein PIIN_00820 [Serendipita indica DSM 11827]
MSIPLYNSLPVRSQRRRPVSPSTHAPLGPVFLDVNGALQFRFTGTNVWVFGKTGGLVRVFVDDQFVKTLDATAVNYSSFPNDPLERPALWVSDSLGAGAHTIKLAGVPGKDLNLLIDFFAYVLDPVTVRLFTIIYSLNGTVIAPSNSAYNPTPAETRKLTGIIVGTLFAFFAVVGLLGFLCFFISRRRKQRALNHNKQPSEKGRVSSAYTADSQNTTTTKRKSRWSFFNLGLSKFLQRKRNTFPLITIVRQREQPSSPAYYDAAHPYSTPNSTLKMGVHAQDTIYPAQQPYSIDQALLQPEAMSPPATSTTSGDEDPFRTHRYVVSGPQVPAPVSSPRANGAFVGGFSTQPRPKALYEPPVSASSGSVYSVPAFGEPPGALRAEQNHRYPPLNVQEDVVNMQGRRGSDEMDEATPLVEKPPVYPHSQSRDDRGRTLPVVSSDEKSASGAGAMNRTTSARRRAVESEEGGYATYGVSSFSPATPTPAYTSWSHGTSSPMPLTGRTTFTPALALPATVPHDETNNPGLRTHPQSSNVQSIPVVAISAPLESSKTAYTKHLPSQEDTTRPPSFNAIHHDMRDTQEISSVERPRISFPQPPPPPGPTMQSFRVPSPSSSHLREFPVSPVSPALSTSSGHVGSVRGPRPSRTSTLVVNEDKGNVSSAVPSRGNQESGRQVVETARGKHGGSRGRGGSDPESPLDPAVVFVWR